MAAGAFPFLLSRGRDCDSVFSGGAAAGIFCLLDWRVEVAGSEAVPVALGLLVSLGTAAAFRLRVDDAVVEDGSVVLTTAEVAFGRAVVAGKPAGREAWATWRAEDLVILGDMSVNAVVQTVVEGELGVGLD